MRPKRPKFDIKMKFVVRRGFTLNGRRHSTGKQLLWRTSSCSERVVRQLYDNKMIDEKGYYKSIQQG